MSKHNHEILELFRDIQELSEAFAILEYLEPWHIQNQSHIHWKI